MIQEKKLGSCFSRPSLDDVVAFRRHVDYAIGRLLSDPIDAEPWRRILLGLNHEQQHQELALTDIKHAFFSNPLYPIYEERWTGDEIRGARLQWHSFDGGQTDRALRLQTTCARRIETSFRRPRAGSSLESGLPLTETEGMVTPSIIVFDVNETLIDIEYLTPLFGRLFGDGRILREWFNQLVLYSNAITLAGYYETFFTLGQGVLKMLGMVYRVPIQQADIEELRVRMLSMPAHEDVPEGLRLLREAGFRLMTLTNSPPDKEGSALERAGLAHFIERQFSVDSVRRFKPAPEVYHLVAKLARVEPSAMCMVAAHTWDTIGAQSAGFAAGLVTRTGNAVLPVDGIPQPQAIAPDLPGVAQQLIALWR